MQTTDTQKRELRRSLLERRRLIGGELRAKLDATLCERLCELEAYKSSDTVLLYSPIKGEPDLGYLAARCLKDGKVLAYPLCDTLSHTLSFHKVCSLDDLRLGAYNIPEPSPSLPRITDFRRALCIVPAIAFDRDGYRLGYGGGFYDRFLRDFSGISVGAVYDELVLPSLPRGEYDLAVDLVITQSKIYSISNIKG